MAVRKLRVIPRRTLKNTYSQRGAIYIQAGVEYVRHVSSLVKTGMNSLKVASFSVVSEGLLQKYLGIYFTLLLSVTANPLVELKDDTSSEITIYYKSYMCSALMLLLQILKYKITLIKSLQQFTGQILSYLSQSKSSDFPKIENISSAGCFFSGCLHFMSIINTLSQTSLRTVYTSATSRG